MLGVSSYDRTFSVGLRNVLVSGAGQVVEFMSADAIPAEAVYMALERDNE